MLLTGHGGEVFSVKFSPDGTSLASGSHDKKIFCWRTYDECENYTAIPGNLDTGRHLEGSRASMKSAIQKLLEAKRLLHGECCESFMGNVVKLAIHRRT
jgi:WD40 repeat protein